jgi:hypothetical protein
MIGEQDEEYQAVDNALRAWVAKHQDGAIMTDFVVGVSAIAPTDDVDETRYVQVYSDSPWHVQRGLVEYLRLSLNDDMAKAWRED